MSDITFRKILWCNEGHDKIWTSFEIDNKLYCAWGRRGGKLSFKSHGNKMANGYRTFSANNLEKLEHQKEQKGYKEVDNFLLFSLFPDFDAKVEEEFLLKTLAGKV